MYAKDAMDIVLSIYDDVGLMLKETDFEKVKQRASEIDMKIDEEKNIPELSDFMESVSKLNKCFTANPTSESIRRESLLNLLSAISEQKSRIVERYSCELED